MIRSIFNILLTLAIYATLAHPASAMPEDPPPPAEEAKVKPEEKPAEEKTEEEPPEKKVEKDRFFAVIGGDVHTVTRGRMNGATILAKNGRIVDIGPDVVVPENAERLDATGFHVYPGLVAVDSGTIFGADPLDDTTDVYALNMTIALAGGITTAVGNNKAGKLSFGSVDDLLVRRDLFETVSYSSSDPDARREWRDAFEKVLKHIREVEAYEEKKKSDPDAKKPDEEWIKGRYKTCQRLLDHEAVAVVSADDQSDILAACALADRYGIRMVIRGATEGWTVASQMGRSGVSAIVTPRRRRDRDPSLLRDNGSSIENAAILHEHGVPVAIIPANSAITTWGVAGRDLLHLRMEAGFAVRGGMSGDDALRAITIDAARILGIDHRVGSIEVGKDADFAITDGDMLHYMTHMRWVVVNGKVAYDKETEPLYSHIRADGDPDAPAPDDYWPRRLGGN
jgi:imidazolonepropionase-like amidohydrolase